MDRREAIRRLTVTLAAAPFLQLPPEKRCGCDMPLWSFEEWRGRNPQVDTSGMASYYLAYQINHDILSHYYLTCPVHGERRFGGPNPDTPT